MARRAQAVPAGARLPEPLFTVLVGYETLAGRVCELASGAVVTPATLLPWLNQAWVERVVFAGPKRVTNVGQRRRLFSGATRRAVEVRDRECYSEFCDPAEECEIDHVVPFSKGGLTIDTNGRPACGYHTATATPRHDTVGDPQSTARHGTTTGGDVLARRPPWSRLGSLGRWLVEPQRVPEGIEEGHARPDLVRAHAGVEVAVVLLLQLGVVVANAGRLHVEG
jgi:hypothetical protein